MEMSGEMPPLSAVRRRSLDFDPNDGKLPSRVENFAVPLPKLWWAKFFLLLGFVTAVLGMTILLALIDFAPLSITWISWANAPELFVVGLGAACLLVGAALLLTKPLEFSSSELAH
jgi:hypothetical protein